MNRPEVWKGLKAISSASKAIGKGSGRGIIAIEVKVYKFYNHPNIKFREHMKILQTRHSNSNSNIILQHIQYNVINNLNIWYIM